MNPSLSEEAPIGYDWEKTLYTVALMLYRADHEGKKMVVHCDFGNNRSRTMVEALYYTLRGEQLPDEYRGEPLGQCRT